MTVIAFDGKTVAADKLSSNGCLAQTVTKLLRAPDGAVLAFCGNAADGLARFAWYTAGADPAQWPTVPKDDDMWASLIVFKAGQKPVKYEHLPFPISSDDDLFAMGCGREGALAAMMAGATAAEAVEIVSRINIHCGRGVDVMELHSDQPSALGGTGAAAPGPAAASNG